METMTRAAAADAGRKRYFTGTPCKNGHITERQTSNGGCTMCMNPLKAKAHQISRTTQPWQPTLHVPYWFVAEHFAALLPCLQQTIDANVTKWIADAEAARSAAANPTPG